jgi:hypothetical protein
VWSSDVGALSVDVTMMGVYLAFVDVDTFIAMWLVSEVTVATVRTLGVDAVRVCPTDVGFFAFVWVNTFNNVVVVVVFGIVSFIAEASVARFSVVAGWVVWAVLDVTGALVDVAASTFDVFKAEFAVAYVAVDCVDAFRVGGASVGLESAFVDVATSKPVAVVSEVAGAFVVSLSVDAVSVSVAKVTVFSAFINICTNTVDVFETIVAEAVVAAFVVDAVCMFATIRWVLPQRAFVYVVAVIWLTAAPEAVIALALPAADCV